MSDTIRSRQEYDDTFGKPPSHRLRREALKCALDIRKFEIDLYWKRANYFWTLLAVTFTGYCTLVQSGKMHAGLVFLVSCIGLVLSTAWYLVNRGSKFWQENWELHVDLLEDEIMGPLYKTTNSSENFNFWNICSGYPYSVSRVNQLVSLFVAVIWAGLFVHSFPHCTVHISIERGSCWLLGLITIFFVILLFVIGLTHSEKTPTKICLSKRGLPDK